VAYLKRKLVCRKMNSLLVLVLLRAIYKPKAVKIVPLVFFLRHYNFREVLAFSTNSFHLGQFLM